MKISNISARAVEKKRQKVKLTEIKSRKTSSENKRKQITNYKIVKMIFILPDYRKEYEFNFKCSKSKRIKEKLKLIEKEKKMNEINQGSEKKPKKRSVYENFDLANVKRKDSQLHKAVGNNFSLLSKTYSLIV
jgi:hypothetical protein